MQITWIGHSTVLLELDGVRLLTDPVLRPRVTHLRRTGIADTTKLGGLDAALISHVHYDHLDVASLRSLGPTRTIVPAGAGKALRRRGFDDVFEVAEDEELQLGSVTVRATHAVHHARRILGRIVPAIGYLVSGSSRTYFAGDTDVFDGMRALSPGLDVALLPVAGWGPRVPEGHLDPARAALALTLLRPRVAVPIHWGTYRRIGLGSADADTLREPAETFARLAEATTPDIDVRILEPGQATDVPMREDVPA
jgi:L-ascorbate metabolism protein UlaG (beta-lactamase superfamily)